MSPDRIGWPADLAARYRETGLWEGIGVAAMVARTAARMPDHVAVVAADRRLTYASLVDDVDRLAAAFVVQGLRAGDRVVVQLPNIVEFVTVYLALNRIGAVPVMALRAHRHAEVRHFLRASGAVAYVIADVVGQFDYRTMAGELAAEFAALRHVIVVGEAGPGQRSLHDLLEAAHGTDVTLDAVDPATISTMLLSGGTTSLSKLIPRTHDDYVLNARLCGAAAGFGPDTVFLAMLPLGHNYNLASPGLLGTFYYGGTVVIASSPDTNAVFSTVARERVTVLAAAVPLIAAWLTDDETNDGRGDVADRHDLSSLKIVQNGGARLPPELRRRLRERFGCTPQEIYGTAEGLINMTRLDDPDGVLLESSGRPVSDEDEIKVVDDAGDEVPDGTSGELLTRGPYTIRGYWNAPEKNREAFTEDGFYRMGDIVRKHGRALYTEGRRKDLINRGGEKISCEEIENLIFAHPKVESVVLVAMPDPVFGEKACACVVQKPGIEPDQTLTFDELTRYLRSKRIASFKLPERLELMASFPISPVGKIMKRELRDLVAAKLASQ